VSIAFRHFEECLTLAPLDTAWLDEPSNAVLRSTQCLDRRMVTEAGPDTDTPPVRTWQYLCQVAGPGQEAKVRARHRAAVPSCVHHACRALGWVTLRRTLQVDSPAPLATSMDALQSGQPVWLPERALPLAFIKQEEEGARRDAEYARALEEEPDEPHWLLGGPASGGVRGRPITPNPRHIKGASRPPGRSGGGGSAAAASDGETDAGGHADAPETMASRRSRRNVGRKTYYEVDNEEEDAAEYGSGGGYGGYGRSNGAPAPPPAEWEAAASGRLQRNAASVQVGLMDAPEEAGRGRRKPGPKRAPLPPQAPHGSIMVLR
jgi:hypothetical protein